MTMYRWQNQDWNPFRQLSMLRQEIDRLFDNSTTGDYSQPFLGNGWPAVDVLDGNEKVVVRVEVPGMKKEEIDISLHEGVLSISGQRQPETAYAKAQVHRSERFAGRFHRAVTLPALVKGEECSATYQDGVLTVVLPKAEEAKPKQIQVNVA